MRAGASTERGKPATEAALSLGSPATEDGTFRDLNRFQPEYAHSGRRPQRGAGHANAGRASDRDHRCEGDLEYFGRFQRGFVCLFEPRRGNRAVAQPGGGRRSHTELHQRFRRFRFFA